MKELRKKQSKIIHNNRGDFMQLTFLGAAHEVTGSCTLLEACGKRLLIDCGLEQGPDIYENCEFPIPIQNIDAVLLTHAHIDHSGKLPYLVANGFSGAIHASEPTYKLCNIMLRDSAHIQESEAEWRNRKAVRAGKEEYVPLYTLQDVENTLPLFVPHHYNENVVIAEGITATFLDAGHLLGSSSILLKITEEDETRTILFSGDLGNPNKPLLRDCKPASQADYVVIESTYGDRLHEKATGFTQKLAEIIRETFRRGGNVVIPAFAVGRTQDMLYHLRIIKEQNLVEEYGNFPVYVDSPLAVEATNIYSSEMSEYFDSETLELLSRGINPISFSGLRVSVTSEESKAINEDRMPKVIISASGMCEAGRIRHHLKHNLWRPESTIIFAGYQSEGTIGRKLLDGAKSVRLFGEEITVRANIVQVDGFSSHADRNMLLDWLAGAGSKRVFVNHGDDAVCDNFALLVEQQLGYPSVAPYSGDIYDLLTDQIVYSAPIKKVAFKQELATKRARTVYDRLLAAGHRLLRVIEQNKGGTNKELGKFTDQIISLCEKYER